MERKRVLIIEDEALIALELETFLTDFGLEVVGIAHTAEQAIALATEHRPHLLMVDVFIKGDIDGIEAARRIRMQLDIPVVFLTAYGDERTLERAKTTAPYGYLLKPYRPDALRAAVTVALYKHSLELQLRESEQWFAKTLHCLTDGVIATDPRRLIRFINPVAESLTGVPSAKAVGQAVDEIFRLRDDSAAPGAPSPLEQAIETGSAVGPRSGILARSGNPPAVAVDHSAAPIRDDDGRVLGGVVVLRDITERRRMETLLRASEERFHSAFDRAAIGMALLATNGEILQTNSAIASLLGYEERELRGRTLRSLSHPDYADAERPLLAALDAEERTAIQLEKVFIHRNGDAVWMHLSASAVRDGHRNPVCYIVQLQDITARKEAERQLEYLAHFDTITGLRNRGSFQLQLAGNIATNLRTGTGSSVMFIDLDGFKHVNDSLGHHVGDQLLQKVAARVKEAVRASDVVARLGGDEFVVLIDDSDSTRAGGVAQKVLEAIARPYSIGEREVSLTASIGVSLCPADGETVELVLRNADSAMYNAKESGRNRFAFYDQALTRRAFERLGLESALRQALARGEFAIHYQPIVGKGDACSVEALLRWHHPERGIVEPEDFIGLAEETGILPEIGDWVVASSCRQLRAWRDSGVRVRRVAVNISFSQLVRPGFAKRVQESLAAHGLSGSDFEVEITESGVMLDPEGTIAALDTLRALGITITVDDFGIGSSSLAQLTRLPVNRLKIDRSFVQQLPEDSNPAAVVAAIVALGEALGLTVVAEGVERAEQADFLRDQRVADLQGYYFAYPAPPEKAAAAVGGLERAGRA